MRRVVYHLDLHNDSSKNNKREANTKHVGRFKADGSAMQGDARAGRGKATQGDAKGLVVL